jgi:imidazolonepropionase-like amidohydrolase
MLEKGNIILEGNRILDILETDGIDANSFDQVLDLRDSFIIPGLIDAHTHLCSATAKVVTEDLIANGTIDGVICARKAIQSGLTTVRDLGCKHGGIYALKRAINSGRFQGPRVYTAGRNLSGTGVVEAWRNYSYDGPDAFRKAVRKEWQDGADWIKLILSDGQWGERDIPLMTLDETLAAVSEAHTKGIRVSCHIDGERGADLALAANVDSIEHGVELRPKHIEEMINKNIFYIPTIKTYFSEVIPVWKTNPEPKLHSHRASFELAYQGGVKIALGTDVNYLKQLPSKALIEEMKMLESWGMDRLQVLSTATITAAEVLGLDTQIGTIEKGKIADIVVLKSNPLDSYEALEEIQLVIQEGKIIFTSPQGALHGNGVELTTLFSNPPFEM